MGSSEGEVWLVISGKKPTSPLLPGHWHLPASIPDEWSGRTDLTVRVRRADVERLLREIIVGATADLRGYAAALSIITARVGDHQLTPGAVAAELKTPMRTLQRQFSARGTTVERSIRAARVLVARSILEDPGYRSLTVSQVARACSMRDGTTLVRAFAKENLAPPASVRSAARRAWNR